MREVTMKRSMIVVAFMSFFGFVSSADHSTLRKDRGYADYYYYSYWQRRWCGVYGYKPDLINLSEHELKILYAQNNNRIDRQKHSQFNQQIHQPRKYTHGVRYNNGRNQ